jgi:hypothetical protein
VWQRCAVSQVRACPHELGSGRNILYVTVARRECRRDGPPDVRPWQEETLDSCANQIYANSRPVFEHAPSFEPHHDRVVCIMAQRLREALSGRKPRAFIAHVRRDRNAPRRLRGGFAAIKKFTLRERRRTGVEHGRLIPSIQDVTGGRRDPASMVNLLSGLSSARQLADYPAAFVSKGEEELRTCTLA